MKRRIIDWEWLVAYHGSEAKALDILECIEAVYIAKTIEVQIGLSYQPRLDRVIRLLGDMGDVA